MTHRKKNATISIPVDAQRFFGDVPVIEAAKDTRLVVTQEECDNAVPRDPTRCILALAAKRAFATDRVWFGLTIALIEMLQEDGTLAVERYVISHAHTPGAVRRLLELFDSTPGVKISPVGVWLKAPKPSERLNHRLRVKRERKKRRASHVGELRETPKKQKRKPVGGMFRHGGGQVHFTPRKTT